MTSETVKLEFLNPYSKYGLKRRPTYDEIAGLIKENNTLTGELPDRNATFFKKTPQGSFFDGLDKLDKIKDEHNRITTRAVQRMLQEQYARENGLTPAVVQAQTEAQERAQTSQQTQPEEFQTPRQTPRLHDAGTMIQSQIQQSTTRAQERIRQTGEAFAENLRGAGSNVLTRLGITGRQSAPSQATEQPLQLPLLEDDDAQTIIPQEPSSSSGIPQSPPALPMPNTPLFKDNLDNTTDKTYWNNNKHNLTIDDIKFQFFLRGIEVPEKKDINEELRQAGRFGTGQKGYREYLYQMIMDSIDNGSWKIKMSNQRFRDLKQAYGR